MSLLDSVIFNINVKSNARYVWLVLILGVVFVAYLSGLSGGFILDDYATFSYLQQWGSIDSIDKLWQFVGKGFTGPTGRPVSLLTFALQASSWPDKPFPFLIVNLIIHLLNTLLVYTLVSRLVRELASNKREVIWLPLLVAFLWAAHPLNVSSVLYVIQRMVLLEAFFNLLAIIAYLYARTHLVAGHIRLGLLYLFGGAVAAVLALFSKENAVLIPLQFGLIELLLLWGGASWKSKKLAYLRLAAVYLPLSVVFLYLANLFAQNIWHFLQTGEEFSGRRSFTQLERVMTEWRIVGDYLGYLLLPKAQTAAVFHDGYPLSTGLFQPISTIAWAAVHALIISTVFAFRRRFHWLAFGVLWFYGNHILESSVVMLELKFEHRNYIPSIGLLLAVGWGLISIPFSAKARMVLVGAVALLLVSILVMRTSLWGDPQKAALVWAEENPRSTRALEHAALVFSNSELKQDRQRSLDFLFEAIQRDPKRPVVKLKYYAYACGTDRVVDYNLESLLVDLSHAPRDWQVGSVLDLLFSRMVNGSCSDIGLQTYQKLLRAVLANKHYRGTRIPIVMRDFLARSELVFGSRSKAVELYSRDMQKKPLGLVMRQSLWMASYGLVEEAASHLENGINIRYDADEFLIEQATDMLDKLKAELDKGND